MNLQRCEKSKNGVCTNLHQKWSYAIPLEIIYLTPLSKWNPYDIEFKGSRFSKLGKTVEAGGRNGGQSLDKAFNGTNGVKFYQTPVEFFSGNEVGAGAADTTKNSVGVLDRKGNGIFKNKITIAHYCGKFSITERGAIINLNFYSFPFKSLVFVIFE
jgi:hypothetical protein